MMTTKAEKSVQLRERNGRPDNRSDTDGSRSRGQYPATLRKARRLEPKSALDILTISPRNASNFRQRKLSYLLKDLEGFGVPREVTAKILTARGVVRNFLIRKYLLRYAHKLSRLIGSGYRAIETGVVRRPAKRDLPPDYVKLYYRHQGFLRGLNSVLHALGEVARFSGYVEPLEDREFLEALRVSSTVVQDLALKAEKHNGTDC